MYFFCAHHEFASFCPRFNSAKAASYPPQFTEREAENQLHREGGAGQEVQPRALALAHQALPPRGVCSSKFQLPSMAPRPAGPGLSPCSLMSHSSPMYTQIISSHVHGWPQTASLEGDALLLPVPALFRELLSVPQDQAPCRGSPP